MPNYLQDEQKFTQEYDRKDITFLRIPTEFKALHEDDDVFTIEGFAATFNNKDLGDDIIMPGAFTESLAKRRPRFLSQHDTRAPIGAIVEAKENDIGLFIKAVMPKDLQLAKDVFSLLKIGALDSFSIGFSVKDFEIRDDGVRLLKQVELFEASIVTIPMNPEARVVGFKSIQDVRGIQSKPELEKFLKQQGISKDAAKYIASRFTPSGDEAGEGKTDDVNQYDPATVSAFHKLKSNLQTFIKEKQNANEG